MPKTLSPFTLYCMSLLIFAVVLKYSTVTNPPPERSATSGTQESRNLLQQATLSAYTADGKLTHRLQSPELWHFSNSGNMKFSEVYFEYYPQSGTGIKVTAEKGTTSKADREIYLNGDVTLRHRDGQTLNTSDITIALDKKIAYTTQPATMTHGKHTTQGVGMFADLDKNEIRLQSRARARYED